MEEKGILALCAMGLGGACYIAVKIWRARAWLQESSVACLGVLQEVLFQISFAVVVPLIYAISVRCPQSLPRFVYFFLSTLGPMFYTGRSLVRRHDQKMEAKDEESRRPRKWWDFRANLPLKDFRMSLELEEEMCFWLSYWSCWPLLGAIQVSLESFEVKGASGLLIALTLYLQVWKGCFLAPYVFTVLRSVFAQCIEYAWSVVESLRYSLASYHWPWQRYLATVLQGDTVMIIAAVVTLVLLCLEVASVVSVFITVILLFSISTESARCVANEAHQMYADRLSFWLLVTCWLWCLRVPALGHILSIWSPLAFGAAFFFGESAFLSIYFSLLRGLATCLACLSALCTEKSSLQEPLLDLEKAEEKESSEGGKSEVSHSVHMASEQQEHLPSEGREADGAVEAEDAVTAEDAHDADVQEQEAVDTEVKEPEDLDKALEQDEECESQQELQGGTEDHGDEEGQDEKEDQGSNREQGVKDADGESDPGREGVQDHTKDHTEDQGHTTDQGDDAQGETKDDEGDEEKHVEEGLREGEHIEGEDLEASAAEANELHSGASAESEPSSQALVEPPEPPELAEVREEENEETLTAVSPETVCENASEPH